MEYLPGGELKLKIRENVFMTEKDSRFYLSEIILAIESLH
jgi:serine/threonine protein kinase